MKKIIILLIILFSMAAYAQDYRIVGKEYSWAASKPQKMEFSFHYPEMKNFKDNITSMNLFNEHISSMVRASSDSFSVWMKGWEGNPEMGSYYEAGDSVFYASNKLISIQFYEGYYFSGAAHPNNSSFSVNYDLVQNKELTLDDMLSSGWESKISDICIKRLMAQIYPDKTVTDDWIQSGAGPDKKNFVVYNVSKEGLVITFPTYQVAAYVNGPSEVFIPYGEIKDIIKSSGQLNSIR